jgi:quinohemoprotein amine dehydrogenase
VNGRFLACPFRIPIGARIMSRFPYLPVLSMRFQRSSVLLGSALVVAATATALLTPSHAGAMQIVVKQPPPIGRPAGIPMTSRTVINKCAACHKMDSAGRMSRISFMRKTPEGWQSSIRRMVNYNNVGITKAEAREIVRYLANTQGLAPEELRQGMFEVERRLVDFRYTADTVVESTCRNCHSMGRVVNQRRSRDEWQLLMDTHRGMLHNEWTFGTGGFGFGPGPRAPSPAARAVDHLSTVFPLETPEWAAWSSTMRPPRLVGEWALAGHELGKGDFYGRLVIAAVPGAADEFTTTATYTYVKGGRKVSRKGRTIVYTGYQWRGRSFDGPDTSETSGYREVMVIDRDWREMFGRWFNGGYDELGVDIRLRRIGAEPVVSGVYPRGLRTGAEQEVRIFGANMPTSIAASALDFGDDINVVSITRAAGDTLVARVKVAAKATTGKRDIFVGGTRGAEAITVYERIDRIQVIPRAGLARVGGIKFPKQFQAFEAIAYDNGPDARPGTGDDIDAGDVDVSWAAEEYPAVFGDEDIKWVGQLDKSGFFTPAVEGPNPQRAGNRNNIGDIWIIATFDPKDGRKPLRGRAHLLVTVPTYVRWDPWKPTGR